MVNFLLCILLSTLLFVILKVFPVFRINTFNAITVNYFFAAGSALLMGGNGSIDHLYAPGLVPAAVITGFLFVTVFYITGLTAQRSGLAVASVASKMSMVIPVLLGLLLYKEHMHFTKALGILIALPAIYLVCKPASAEEKSAFRVSNIGLPLLLFFGAGVVDSMIKVMQHYYVGEGPMEPVFMLVFFCAGVFGLIRVFWGLRGTKKFITSRDFIGGAVLGIANFFSLFYMVKCLSSPSAESSEVFTIINTGVVAGSTLTALIFFHEAFNRDKWIGIVLALLSIFILSL